ncbi:uncharacterized protein TNCV_3759381 [Trichonephila clavipes]|nr:uncharacterized protein TNCV_3759381 [Trichonephila clavipes]
MHYEVCKLSNETGCVVFDLATLGKWDMEGRSVNMGCVSREDKESVSSNLSTSEICMLEAVKKTDRLPGPYAKQEVRAVGRRSRQPVINRMLDLSLLDDTYTGITKVNFMQLSLLDSVWLTVSLIWQYFVEETGAFGPVTVTCHHYEYLLNNHVILNLQQRGCVDGVVFMQDNAPPHIAISEKQLLKGHFGNSRVISCHFPTA